MLLLLPLNKNHILCMHDNNVMLVVVVEDVEFELKYPTKNRVRVSRKAMVAL